VAHLYSRSDLLRQRERWKAEKQTVVFTNGCFDLLHPGHIRLLEQARSMGDVLILGLNSDASVRRTKGASRPLLPATERAAVVQGLEAVDAVTLFEEDTPQQLIAQLLPDVLVKGADWSHFIAGREAVESGGGRVVALPVQPGYSTTKIVVDILNQP
jgi:rfaE bifunctional protein nucleotidyltransferase chain/domain